MNSCELFFEDPLLSFKIAEILKEKEIDLIQTIVESMGGDFAIMMLEKVKALLEAGGLERKNGGKRSPGGIFFSIVRENITEDQAKNIFKKQALERKKRYRARKKLLMKINKLEII